jgi:hypothetical protein
MARWPADNQAALLKFYGTPGPDVERQLVDVIPPFQMYYDGKPVRRIRFHRKAADALRTALAEIWDHYGHDQRKIDALGISKYSGGYNPRKVRGSDTKWSNHAFGAAIDINAEENGFNTGHGTMPQPVINAFKRQGARWGGDYRGRTDPMHFEFCNATGYPGPVTLPVKAFDDDLPVDMPTDTDADPVPAAPAAKAGFFKRAIQWTGGGAGLGFLGYLTDWKVVAVLLGGLLIVATAFVLFMGPAKVRAWIAREADQ